MPGQGVRDLWSRGEKRVEQAGTSLLRLAEDLGSWTTALAWVPLGIAEEWGLTSVPNQELTGASPDGNFLSGPASLTRSLAWSEEFSVLIPPWLLVGSVLNASRELVPFPHGLMKPGMTRLFRGRILC